MSSKIRKILGFTPKYSFSTKATAEVEYFFWDFSRLLVGGETISTATITVTVVSGSDASPSAIKSGSTTHTNGVVKQLITGGVNGVFYLLSCAVTTSASHTYTLAPTLLVSNS